MFLDEPTSGLDSHNALLLTQLLKKVANAGASVMFTIHQPSSEIFNSFDRLILLNMGRVMYQGLVPDIPTYFSDRGYPIPKHYNPADHIMHVALMNSIQDLEKDGFFPSDERKTPVAFVSDEAADKDPLGITNVGDNDNHEPPPGFGEQTKMLFGREIKNLYRNTHALKARTLMTGMVSVLVGCIFWQVAGE